MLTLTLALIFLLKEERQNRIAGVGSHDGADMGELNLVARDAGFGLEKADEFLGALARFFAAVADTDETVVASDVVDIILRPLMQNLIATKNLGASAQLVVAWGIHPRADVSEARHQSDYAFDKVVVPRFHAAVEIALGEKVDNVFAKFLAVLLDGISVVFDEVLQISTQTITYALRVNVDEGTIGVLFGIVAHDEFDHLDASAGNAFCQKKNTHFWWMFSIVLSSKEKSYDYIISYFA